MDGWMDGWIMNGGWVGVGSERNREGNNCTLLC